MNIMVKLCVNRILIAKAMIEGSELLLNLYENHKDSICYNESLVDEIKTEIKEKESQVLNYTRMLKANVESEKEYVDLMREIHNDLLGGFVSYKRKEDKSEEAMNKALNEIDAYNKDMTMNPDSYFEPDDERRQW